MPIPNQNREFVRDLVLASPDVYYWHHADLPFFSVTRPVRRCLVHLPSPESPMPRTTTPSPQ
jgi:hypothetical protein